MNKEKSNGFEDDKAILTPLRKEEEDPTKKKDYLPVTVEEIHTPGTVILLADGRKFVLDEKSKWYKFTKKTLEARVQRVIYKEIGPLKQETPAVLANVANILLGNI